MSISLSRKFPEVLRSAGFPCEGASVLCAFSGGADSTALLHLLKKYSEELLFSVSALHVHHGIRGAEADRDAEFCRAFCESHNIPFILCRTDVPALAAKSGRSLEEEARIERYRLLGEALAGHPEISVLMTAHHADDQAETVLFRMLRGSDIRGLAGIRSERDFPLPDGRHVRLVRPLLSFTKDEILAYCGENGLSYVTDSTNTEPDCARNRIRVRIMPEARKINPSFSEALLRTAAAAERDESYFREETEKLTARYSELTAIPLPELRALHPAISGRVLAALHEKAVSFYLSVPPHVHPLSADHIKAMQDALLSVQSPKTICLPGDLLFSVFPAGALCSFSRLNRSKAPCAQISAQPLLPGVPVFLPDGTACLSVRDDSCDKISEDLKNVYNFFISTHINSDKIKEGVLLRTRCGGEADIYLCGGSHKTAADALSAHKVLPEMRARIPLFCDSDGILWIPFCGIADRCNPKYAQERLSSLSFYYFYGPKENI